VIQLVAPLGRLSGVILFEIDLSEPRPVVRARVPIVIRRASEADLENIAAFLWGPAETGGDARWPGRTPEQADQLDGFADRLERGEACFIATVDSEIVHVNWTCFSWGEALPNLPIIPHRDEVYTTDGETGARWRGKRIHEEVLNEMLRYAQLAGRRRAYTLARLGHRRPRRGIERLGWRTRCTLVYFVPRKRRRLLMLRLGGDMEPLLRGMAPPDTRATPG
jgi:hypothetical protein